MVELTQLWLPILLSAVAVFFLSYVMWMVAPHHKSDWVGLPDEDGLMDVLRSMGAKGRQYTFPFCADAAQMKDPAFLEKYDRGPKGYLLLRPEGPLNMGVSMGVSFVFNVVIALLVADAAAMVIPAGDPQGVVFRFVWTVAFLANGAALGWGAIWFGRTWSSTLKEMFDCLVYSGVTAGLFVAFWPDAVGV